MGAILCGASLAYCNQSKWEWPGSKATCLWLIVHMIVQYCSTASKYLMLVDATIHTVIVNCIVLATALPVVYYAWYSTLHEMWSSLMVAICVALNRSDAWS